MTTTLPVQNVPKASVPNLEWGGSIKDQRYLIQDKGLYHIFPIQIEGNEDAPILRFEVSPPVLMEGIAVFRKNFYRVTLEDLQRGIIRKSRLIDLSKRAVNGNGTSGGDPVPSPSNISESGAVSPLGTELQSGSGESRSSQDSPLEIAKAIDATWNDQIGALLGYLSEKEGEEWEISETS